MNRVDEGFEPPDALVEWCRSRTFPLHVLDDEATVDLDWWNAHLKDAGHTISLRGRDLDGKVITEGRAIVQRNDLRPSSDLVVAQHDGLGLLFLCAAWQGSHESRRFTRRFPNVFNPHHREDEDPLTQITAILDHCSKNKSMPVVRRDTWSGWPLTPGVGVSLMAAFMWAVGVQDEGRRAQMIDQYGVSTLIHEGWLEDPSSPASRRVATAGTANFSTAGPMPPAPNRDRRDVVGEKVECEVGPSTQRRQRPHPVLTLRTANSQNGCISERLHLRTAASQNGQAGRVGSPTLVGLPTNQAKVSASDSDGTRTPGTAVSSAPN